MCLAMNISHFLSFLDLVMSLTSRTHKSYMYRRFLTQT